MFVDWKTTIVKMSLLSGFTSRFNVILIKILQSYFVEINNLTQKTHKEIQRTYNRQNIFEKKKNKVRGLTSI